MATSKKYNDRMTTEAANLVARLAPALTRFDDLYTRVNNPICGKPGKGFKAARKLRPQLRELEATVNQINAEIATFIRPTTKMPIATAEKRKAYIDAAKAEWGM